MSQAHEKDIAKWFGGSVSPGSGNQWHSPGDGRTSRWQRLVSWAWDCKATRANSISITREMLDKITDQAQGEWPMVPIRFYGDDRLTVFEDWTVVRIDDLLEMRALAEGTEE